jgi:hypothetical protein
MNTIQIIKSAIEAEQQQHLVTSYYYLLGYFGDRLPNDVQKELRAMAEAEQVVADKMRAKIAR